MTAKAPVRQRWPIVLGLILSAAFAAIVFARLHPRTDLTAFLPTSRDPATRFMLDELRGGNAAGLVLIAIDNAPAPDLARASTAMVARLSGSGLFSLVAGGTTALQAQDLAFLFDNRFLLSPSVQDDAFTPAHLRNDVQAVLRQLRSSAAPVAVRYGLPDPIGAFPALMRNVAAGHDLRMINGAWFAPNQDRALIVAHMAAAGLDTASQDHAITAIRDAFAAQHLPQAHLILTGPAVFAHDAAHTIRQDAERISMASTLLVILVLFWRFRSVWVVGAVAIPVLIGTTVAALVVQTVFGFVQGAALGFGITMLGVTVDYPVLLIGHRKQGEAASGTLRRIGGALRMSVISAALGLTGLVFCGLPGLAQLGVFSVTGVLSVALASWFILPRLIVAADLAPVAAGDPARLLRVERWRRGWWAGAVAAGVAGFSLLIWPPQIQASLAALSPVPARDLETDAALRAELGLPDSSQMLVVRGPDADTVLRHEEGLVPFLTGLMKDGVAGPAEYAARLLPSVHMQQSRQHALPAPDDLHARMQQAADGLGFRPDAFAAFLTGVESSRTRAPVRPDTLLASPIFAARLAPLLFARGAVWFGLIALPVHHQAAFVQALTAQAEPDLWTINPRAQTEALVHAATRRTWMWLGMGGVAILAVLAVGLRDTRMLMRVTLAVMGACVCTLALLHALSAAGLGSPLSLLHVVALQFVAGLGLDYALFFARPRLDVEERARTLRTLTTCNALTLLTFGGLALCRTPILHDIGLTITIGAALAMILAFLLAGPRQAQS